MKTKKKKAEQTYFKLLLPDGRPLRDQEGRTVIFAAWTSRNAKHRAAKRYPFLDFTVEPVR